MRIRSHLDPTTFITFDHIDARAYDKEFAELAKSTRKRWAEHRSLILERERPWARVRGIIRRAGRLLGLLGPRTIDPIISALRDKDVLTSAHEQYHFWQGLRLPFLHLYATTTLQRAIRNASRMARRIEEWNQWDTQKTSFGFEFSRLDRKIYIGGNRNGRITWDSYPLSGFDVSLELSAKEMLEGAASIFDFQISCGKKSEMSDPVHFKRWCKRNPAYTRVVAFLADYLASDRLALRLALPLINAAFHTSMPETAFVHLARQARQVLVEPREPWKSMLSQEEPIWWSKAFHEWLVKDFAYGYHHPVGSYPEDIDLTLSSEFYYLVPEHWLGETTYGGGLKHPFLGPSAAKWRRAAKKITGLEAFLDFPGYYLPQKRLRNFVLSIKPPVQVVSVFLEGQSICTFPLVNGDFSPAFLHPSASNASSSQGRGFIVELLSVYGAFRRATGAHMTEVARTCHHRDCPHFAANFCNFYLMIPERHEDCAFPQVLHNWILRRRQENEPEPANRGYI